jgi:phosphohistidine phosphatase
MELYLLRHAHAGDPAAWQGDDTDRPLSDQGIRQARRTGRLLAAISWQPNAIVTSPKVRAAQTAAIVAEALHADVAVDDRLAGAFDLDALRAILGERSGRRVMLVGHDPDFSDLVSELVGAAIALKKGALARIDLDGPVEPGGGVLRWLIPPGALPG